MSTPFPEDMIVRQLTQVSSERSDGSARLTSSGLIGRSNASPMDMLGTHGKRRDHDRT